MWVKILAEPAQGPQLPTSVVPTTTCGELDPGSSQVPICLRNLSAHPIVIPTKLVVGKVTLANQLQLVVFLMGTSGESTCRPWQGLILEGIEPPGHRAVAQGGRKSGQEVAGQMAAPVHLQSPGSGGRHPSSSNELSWLTRCPSKSTTPPICMMIWRPISWRCWTAVTSGNQTVHGLAQWSWSEIRIWEPKGSALTSGNWTVRLSRMPTCYPSSMKPSIVCRGPNGSSHSTWSQGTGRSRWTRRANHWLHLTWSHWDSTSVIECPLGWPMPLLSFSSWWKPSLGTSTLISVSST